MTSKPSPPRVMSRLSRKVFVVLLSYVVMLSQSEISSAQTKETSLFPVCRSGRCGYIDYHGRLAIDLRFEEAWRFTEGLAAIRLGPKWGFVDDKGRIAISVQFANAGEFSGGLAPVQTASRWGYIDKAGRMVIEPLFDEAKPFSFGFAWVRTGGDWSYIDSTGHRSSIAFWGAPNFSEGLTPAVNGNKIGYVNSQLNWSIKPQFTDGGRFSEGVAPVQLGEKWGYINRSGDLVIQPRFVKAQSFSEGLAAVADGMNREGYVDKSGRFVIAPKFRDAEAFSEGLAPVIYQGQLVSSPKEHTGLEFVGARWAYINKSGKVVIRLDRRTDYAGPFIQGMAYIRLKRGPYGYIDRKGRYVWRPSI